MLGLIPASVAALGFTLRNLWMLRWSALSDSANSLRIAIADGKEPDDAGLRETLRLFVMLQPLSALFVLAPLAGLLGSILQLMELFGRMESGSPLSQSQTAEAFRCALVAPAWGVALSAFCYLWYAIFRARIMNAEEELFCPSLGDSPQTETAHQGK